MDVDVDVDVNDRLQYPAGSTVVFGFEKLDVYRCAIEFLAVSAKLLGRVPRGYSSLKDQLKRASLSIPVNIAEGAGRTTRADQRRQYGIARGSAMECAAILSACRVLEIAPPEPISQGRQLLFRVTSMLSRMCR